MKYIKSFKFWLACLIVVYTFVGFVIVPWFITNKVPAILKDKIGINLSLGKTSFNPYTYELTLRNITLKDQNQKTAFELKKFYVDYTFFGILTKTFIFNDILIDSARLYATINQDGNLNLLNIMPKTIKKAEPKATKKSSLPSILLRHMSIANGEILVTDTRSEKNFTANLGPYNFTAHDISTDKGELNAYTFKTLIDGKSELLWKGGMSISPLKLYGKISIKNLDLPKLYKYALPDIGANLKQGSLSLTLPYQIDMSKKIEARINNAKLILTNIDLNDKKSGKTLINTKNISLNDFNLYWPKQTIFIDSFKIEGTNLYAKLSKDGVINLAKAFKIKSKPEQNTTSSKPWKYLLKNAILDDMNVFFDNQQLKVPTKTQISKLSLHVSNISSNKKAKIEYKLGLVLNKNSKIKISGSAKQLPLSAKAKVNLANIQISDFENYLTPFVNFKIKKANLNARANVFVNLQNKLYINLSASTYVKKLQIDTNAGKKLLAWDDLRVNGIKFKTKPMSLIIKNIKLDKPFIVAHVKKDGTTNFSNLVKKSNKTTKTKSNPIKIKIGPMKLTNGVTDYSDDSLPFPFRTLIHDLNGDISTLDYGSTTPSIVKFNGKIDKYGYADIEGVILPFKIKKRADINVLFKNIDLTSLTPYSGKFLGYKIKHGKLSMDLNYKISNASLKGSNKINIDTLDLGDTVKSKDALSLPLGLAIALLKDSNNQINIDLPVAGDMNNPDFSYGGVVWGAIGHMITGIVTAPFRFLGSLLGIKGDDLKAIDFKGGSFIIISTEQEKLTNLEKIMGKRPNIKLEVNGGYDEIVDTKALQKEQFITLVKSKFAKIKKDTNSSKSDRYGTILKNLYSKEFTLTKYNKLKASFMVVPKVDDNKTKVKKELKKPKQIKKPVLNVTAFNDKMQNTLINNIKISKEKLEALANNRAKAIIDTLVTKYKINPKRVKVLKPISQEAKRGKWIGSKISISM